MEYLEICSESSQLPEILQKTSETGKTAEITNRLTKHQLKVDRANFQCLCPYFHTYSPDTYTQKLIQHIDREETLEKEAQDKNYNKSQRHKDHGLKGVA